MVARVLIPLPDRDFDTTEVSVPWRYLTGARHEVVFATERGKSGPAPECDPRLLTGVLFGALGADPEPIGFYCEMQRTREFSQPIAWKEIDPSGYDGLVLPGGPEMRTCSRRRSPACWKAGEVRCQMVVWSLTTRSLVPSARWTNVSW